uniref:Uncharacterized protein n=1 Tax=Rhizophora mucronata TaxID=61149 RepID=A0A2P2R0C3_RHIMU
MQLFQHHQGPMIRSPHLQHIILLFNRSGAALNELINVIPYSLFKGTFRPKISLLHKNSNSFCPTELKKS